ncbi:MAG: tRNA (adenosine(37)-N6)-threonylcarbamoyltransferase complex transferase subunit TsaD [Planctomycetes bacterium]|nr:tRNA (adenosine(37)-N6)-threonylcarbamoyltransferase complex transferase subunit TsaD [Planctomycetota bacterium]
MKILGVESSCDECAAAMVEDGVRVLSDVVSSQVKIHARYGGVVPEIASRRHMETILPVIEQALKDAGLKAHEIDAVAVTNRPGLIGALLVGLSAAKGLALALNKPLIPVHHIEAHLYAALMNHPAPVFPLVGLVVSGGHTSLYRINSPIEVTQIASTLDDAAGEAFDKVASILGLGYPGGPVVEKTASGHGKGSISFPRSFPGGKDLHFSFSGLKTAVLYHCKGVPGKKGAPPRKTGSHEFDPENPGHVADVAASFQTAVVEVLIKRTFQAMDQEGAKGLVVGGGVAANKLLRQRLKEEAAGRDISLYLSPSNYATDNAVMIAGLAYPLFNAGRIGDLETDAYAR